jgi:hypothetical protein
MRERLADWFATALMVAIIPALLFAMAVTVLAAPPSRSAGSCSVDGTVVTATGLPTDQVVNFMVTDGSGTDGWVLGTTWEGTWAVSVPTRNGWTKYEFASRTWGKNGAKYRVFASCAAS